MGLFSGLARIFTGSSEDKTTAPTSKDDGPITRREIFTLAAAVLTGGGLYYASLPKRQPEWLISSIPLPEVDGTFQLIKSSYKSTNGTVELVESLYLTMLDSGDYLIEIRDKDDSLLVFGKYPFNAKENERFVPPGIEGMEYPYIWRIPLDAEIEKGTLEISRLDPEGNKLATSRVEFTADNEGWVPGVRFSPRVQEYYRKSLKGK